MNFSLSSALKCACPVLFAALLGCSESDGTAELAAGREAYELQDLKKAERLFEESLAASPDDVDRILYLARVKRDLGELPEASKLLEKAQALAGDDSDVRLLAAQVAWQSRDCKTAADGFAAIGNDARLEPSVRAQGWAGLGVVELSRENHHLARVAFLRALGLDRRNASARYHLGFLYQEAFGYLEAALEQFDIFSRLEPEADVRVQKVQRSIIPALKEKIAREAADRPGAGKRNAAASSAAVIKADAAWKKGQYKTARQSYQEALAADPLSYPAAFGLARVWEKTDTTRTGQLKALENYVLACKLRPSAIATFLTAGALASRLGQSSQAVEIYSRAIAASPTSFDAIDGLIRALRKVGGKANVAAAYQQYRESIPARRK